jgi:CHASE3 domain sensor protein
MFATSIIFIGLFLLLVVIQQSRDTAFGFLMGGFLLLLLSLVAFSEEQKSISAREAIQKASNVKEKAVKHESDTSFKLV